MPSSRPLYVVGTHRSVRHLVDDVRLGSRIILECAGVLSRRLILHGIPRVESSCFAKPGYTTGASTTPIG